MSLSSATRTGERIRDLTGLRGRPEAAAMVRSWVSMMSRAGSSPSRPERAVLENVRVALGGAAFVRAAVLAGTGAPAAGLAAGFG